MCSETTGRYGVPERIAVEDVGEPGVRTEPRGGGGAVSAQRAEQLFRSSPAAASRSSAALPVSVTLLALQLGDELVERLVAVRRILRREDLVDELRERDRAGCTTTGFISVTSWSAPVEVDGVEDAEDLLADLRAEARRAAEHLLVEDAAADPAQEHEVGDLRHVDAGGEQVDGDRDVRAGARS